MSKIEPLGPVALPFGPFVALYDACSIRRRPSGGFLVSHQACPERTWLTANLPSAHALCAELRLGHYGCRTALDASP